MSICLLVATTLPAFAATKTLTKEQKISRCINDWGYNGGYTSVTILNPNSSVTAGLVWQCNGNAEVEVTKESANQFCKALYGRKATLKAKYFFFWIVDWNCQY